MCSTSTATKGDMKTHIQNVHNLFEIVEQADAGRNNGHGLTQIVGPPANKKGTMVGPAAEVATKRRLTVIETDDYLKNSLSKLEKLAGVNAPADCTRGCTPFWQCLACKRPFSTKLQLQQHVQITHVEPVQDFGDCSEIEMDAGTSTTTTTTTINATATDSVEQKVNGGGGGDEVAADTTNEGGSGVDGSRRKELLLKLSICGYCCEICGRCFDEIDYLFVHYQVVHPASDPPLVKHLHSSAHSAMLCFVCLLYYRNGRWFNGHHCVNEVDVGLLEKMKRAADIAPRFLCDVCAAVFKWKSMYQYHRETKHKNVTSVDWDAVEPATIPHVCPKCCKGFVEAKGLREHICRPAGYSGADADVVSKPVVCPVCGTRLSSRFTLRRHIRYMHENAKRTSKPRRERTGKCYRPSQPTIKCPFCELKFKTSKDTLQHAHDVHSQLLQTPYYCVPCGRTFEMNQKLIKHNRIYHFGPDDPAEMERVCKEAEMTTLVVGAAAAAAAAVEGDGNGRGREARSYYACGQCSRKFADAKSYFLHHRWHQRVERNFTCERCGKPMTTKAALRTHILHVHEKEWPRYECDVCHKTLASKFSLREHLAAHDNVRAFTCEKCGKSFVSKTRLQYHVRRHIFGSRDAIRVNASAACSRRYKCSECDKEFKKKQSLTDHLAVHSGVKNFHCPDCGKLFFTKLHVYFHKLHVHCTERPYKCSRCNAAFPLQSYLRRHYKLHDQAAATATAAKKRKAQLSGPKNEQRQGGGGEGEEEEADPEFTQTEVIFEVVDLQQQNGDDDVDDEGDGGGGGGGGGGGDGGGSGTGCESVKIKVQAKERE